MSFTDLLEIGLRLLVPGGAGAGAAAVGQVQEVIGAAADDPAIIASGRALQGDVAGAIIAGTEAQRRAGAMAMKNRVRTIVQTISPSGAVIRQEIFPGRPFLMQKDFTTAKRVIKLAAKAHGKIPRRTMKQGMASKITDAVQDEVLRTVAQKAAPQICPPRS